MEEISHGQSDDGDAQGHPGGHRPCGPGDAAGVRLPDHGAAPGAGLRRTRRGNRLRPAHPHRAAWLRRCAEGPVREGAAAQGLFAQYARAPTARRVLEDMELPLGTDRKAPDPNRTRQRTRRELMVAKWIETLTGSLEQKK